VDPQQILTRLKSATESFTTAQLATLALTFVLVVSVIAGSAWYLNKPTYALLFADMDEETAGQIITKLKTMKIPYELDPGGRAIRVPSDRVDELRIDLTAAGLPQTGRVGFEITAARSRARSRGPSAPSPKSPRPASTSPWARSRCSANRSRRRRPSS
jgi:flagellar M-ring protein FliF